MPAHPLKVAWITYFPVEWLPEAPPDFRAMPKHHPASWQRVLFRVWLEQNPGLELHIIALRKQFPRSCAFTVGPAKFYCLRTLGGLRAPSLFWYDTWIVRKRLRAVDPDLVHAWGTENGAALIATRLPYPYLVTVQGLMTWFCQVMPNPDFYNRMAAWLEKRSLPRAPLVTTESRFAVDFVQSYFAPRKVLQIEHAPDPVFHQIPRRPPRDVVRLVVNGRFHYAKGPDLLLQALHRRPPEVPWELVHIGLPSGPWAKQCKAQFPESFWRRIQFRSHLTLGEVAEELSRATLLVCPTRVDVSPNSVKEAVVAGVPVVGACVGGIPDYVLPGQNGVLFKPGDLESLIRALHQALEHPLFRRGEVDPETLSRMRDYLSPSTMARRFYEAYQLMISESSKQTPAPNRKPAP
jgi:glycosyltransferase involved in cell wall biosynthesis